MPVERKYERDIDLLLVEEFAVNARFAEQFKALCGFGDKKATIHDFWVSKRNKLGESDLIIVYQTPDEERFAILIEDKIHAPLQPEQAKRYRDRADREVSSGLYTEYRVILCAPQSYLDGRAEWEGFDLAISLERVAEIIREDDTHRSEYRADYLETAANKRVNNWSREVDPHTNRCWKAAYNLAKREFTMLEMKRPEATKGQQWYHFRPSDFPIRPHKVQVTMKPKHGRVDLTFGSTQSHLFRPRVEEILDESMSIAQAKGSTAVRIELDEYDVMGEMDNNLNNIRLSFEASVKLIELYRNHKSVFDKAAIDSGIQ